MSKTGQWVFEMQEEAVNMNLSEFIERYGRGQADIWFEANDIRYEDVSQDVLDAEEEGFHGS